MKFLTIAVWVILTILVMDLSFMLITLPDTVLNIIGAIVLAVWIVATYKTRCLTRILKHIKTKRDEKNN